MLLFAAFWLASPRTEGQEPSDEYWDVSSDAIQTYYQAGVPHVDAFGNLRDVYEAGVSFLPIGIYGADVCRSAATIDWSPYIGPTSIDSDGDGVPNWTWNGTYELAVDLVDVPPSEPPFPSTPDRVRVHSGLYDITTVSLNTLPAGERLRWAVVPSPALAHLLSGGAILEQAEIGPLPCPADETHDPNVVQTLADGGFNFAVTTPHPATYIRLKEAAGIQDFKFVLDASKPSAFCQLLFTENLFASDQAVPPGQGYSEDAANIFGWLTEDEPLAWSVNALAACVPEPGCTDTNMDGALERLRRKYEEHRGTSQLIFHVEAAPPPISFTTCDPGGKWEESVQIGDVGNHDLYLKDFTLPLTSLRPIADSMTRQTNALVAQAVQAGSHQKPSWFTAQAWTKMPAIVPTLVSPTFPTPQENQATIYTAIVHGATGITYWILDGVRTRDIGQVGVRPSIPTSYPEQLATQNAPPEYRTAGEELWAGIAALNQELKDIEHILFAPTSASEYQVAVKAPGQPDLAPVHTMLKLAEGTQYLIAVNMEDSAVDAQFTFTPGTLAEVQMQVTSNEGPSTATIAGDVLSDTLEPFGVRVYRLISPDSDADGTPDYADDSDSDGCTDGQELQTAEGSEAAGGLRDPSYFWDFLDVPTVSGKDFRVDGFDIGAVVNRFGTARGTPPTKAEALAEALTPPTDTTGYHAASDRDSPDPGANVWNVRPPNGFIDGFDISFVVFQFGHSCA